MQELLIELGLICEDFSRYPQEEISRVPTVNHPTSKNGWIFIGKDRHVAVAGNWETGGKKTIVTNPYLRRQDVPKEISKAISTYKIKKQNEQRVQAKKIQSTYNRLPNVDEFPYLEVKNVKPCNGLKIYKDKLFIPIFSFDNEIISFQTITPEGDKKFAYGAKAEGGFFTIDGHKHCVILCEGLATGLTLNQTLGLYVFVCFSAHNMVKVAEELKNKKIGKILIAADNDESDTGLKEAKKCLLELPNAQILMPPDVGDDWNDHVNKHGTNLLTTIIYSYLPREKMYDPLVAKSIEEIKTEHEKYSTTIIPPKLYQNTAIETGIKMATDLLGYESITFSFVEILMLISTAISNKIQVSDNYSSHIIFKIAKSGSNKSHIYNQFHRVLYPETIETLNTNEIKSKLYGVSKIASGPAYFRYKSKNPFCYDHLDEIQFLIEQGNSNDTLAKGKREAILELFSSSGKILNIPYADENKNLLIKYPCINIAGGATSLLFSTLKIDDVESGLVARILFFTHDDKLEENEIFFPKNDTANVKAFKDFIFNLINVQKPIERIPLDQPDNAINIGMSLEAQALYIDYKLQGHREMNNNKSDLIRTCLARKLEHAVKLSLIHHAATKKITKLFEPVEKTSLEWGIELTEILTGWKINYLIKKIPAGIHDKHIKMLIEAFTENARHSGVNECNLTKAIEIKPLLGNLNRKDWEYVLTAVKARKLVEAFKDKNNETYYKLIKYQKNT